MKKPWQVWTLFFLCLIAVAMAMLWLSLKAYRLDSERETDRSETELARREAELQERISSALYRMDLKMLPLVAREAARPAEFYRASNNEESSPFPSNGSVLLHFEIEFNNNIQSPLAEVSVGSIKQETTSAVDSIRERINKARQLFDYQALSKKYVNRAPSSSGSSNLSAAKSDQQSTAYSVPAVDNFQHQLESQANEPDNNYAGNKIDQQRSRGDQRINSEFTQRRNSTQGLAGMNRDAPILELPSMQSIWVGENLVMARAVPRDGIVVLQCCWLDWEKIQSELQSEVADLIPDVRFEAVSSESDLKIGTALTTLPIQLIVDRPKMLATLALESTQLESKSALTFSLVTAWCCLGLATFASAVLLHGVVRLSERRAAFVSAVTHELRTPLTTFRMYSEMLADGMVPPEKQYQYANTLKVQADRLSHLVDNVLQFARLERGPVKIANETVNVLQLLERFRLRLEERAGDGQMKLLIQIDEVVSNLSFATQPAAIEQILFNLVDNACKYAQTSSDKRIELTIGRKSKHLQFCVRDFGPGIEPRDRKRLFEPFQQSANATANQIPGVGLGLALCDRMSQSLGGRLFNRPCSTGAMFILEVPLNG